MITYLEKEKVSRNAFQRNAKPTPCEEGDRRHQRENEPKRGETVQRERKNTRSNNEAKRLRYIIQKKYSFNKEEKELIKTEKKKQTLTNKKQKSQRQERVFCDRSITARSYLGLLFWGPRGHKRLLRTTKNADSPAKGRTVNKKVERAERTIATVREGSPQYNSGWATRKTREEDEEDEDEEEEKAEGEIQSKERRRARGAKGRQNQITVVTPCTNESIISLLSRSWWKGERGSPDCLPSSRFFSLFLLYRLRIKGYGRNDESKLKLLPT